MLKLSCKDSNIFFSSDFHYFHTNMAYGESVWANKETGSRKFDTTKEMSRHIVAQINSCIKENDILFFLGDWSFGGIQNIWNFRKQLNVKTIHFILGNHDHHIEQNKVLPNCSSNFDVIHNSMDYHQQLNLNLPEKYDVKAQELFTSVQHYLEVMIDGHMFCLSHYPMDEWNDRHHKSKMLHGHSHGNAPIKENRLDVGMDNYFKLYGEYKPFSLKEIKEYFK